MKHPLLPGMVILQLMLMVSCTHKIEQTYPSKLISQDLSKLTQIELSTDDDFSGSLSLHIEDNHWHRHESYAADSIRSFEIQNTKVFPMIEAIKQTKIKVLPGDATAIRNSAFKETITVYLYFRDGIEDQSMIFGSETIENGQPYTYLLIWFKDKEYICLAEGHLRSIFDKNNYDFHKNVVAKFSPLELTSISTTISGHDTLFFQKNELNWECIKDQAKQNPKSVFFEYFAPPLQQEHDFRIQLGCIPPSTGSIVKDLLRQLPELNGGQRLEKFSGEKTTLAKIFLVSKGDSNPITLTFFKTQHQAQKEDTYLIHSSTTPEFYFLPNENNFTAPQDILQRLKSIHKMHTTL